ncbi:MAG: ABC transporter permease [Oscillospiraceae bacterium]|nr:ABC transporter permease [Oscillospiraceae bacterium]
MLIVGVILIVLGVPALIVGLATLLTVGNYSLSVSLVIFGVIALGLGVLSVLSNRRENIRRAIRKVVGKKEFTLIVVLAVIVYIFWMINHNYITLFNVRNIFNAAFVMGTLAIGGACLLIGGKIDLSAGSTGMMAGVIIAMLLGMGIHWITALIITLVFGAVTGLINAFFVNGMNFVPFISTLAVSSVYGGLARVMTNAQNIPISSQEHPVFLALGSTNIGVFPLPFFITIILLIVYGVILSSTKFGRRVYMVGGNSTAARLAGINPKKITTLLFVNNGVLASLAGILMAARMHSGSPSAILGSDLDGYTAAILGGVAFVGGSGSMLGVFIGIVLLSSFQNGLVVTGLGAYYRVIASGLLLIAALILDYFRENSRIRALRKARHDS